MTMSMYIVPDAYQTGMQTGKLFDYASRSSINHRDENAKIEDVFSTNAVTGLVGLWKAIKKLSAASQDLFITLLDETDIINERIEKINSRIDVVVPSVKKIQQMSSLAELKGFKAKNVSYPSKQFIFTKNSMVRSLKMKYDECPHLPPLQSLDSETASLMPSLDEKTKSYSLLYSNPLHIYYMWQEATQKAYEEEMKERKQRRAQRRAERQRLAEENGEVLHPKKKEIRKITLFRNQLNKHGAIGELLEKQGISLLSSSPPTTIYLEEATSNIENYDNLIIPELLDNGTNAPMFVHETLSSPLSKEEELQLPYDKEIIMEVSHINPIPSEYNVEVEEQTPSISTLPLSSFTPVSSSSLEDQSNGPGQPLVNPSARKESPPSPTTILPQSQRESKTETSHNFPPPPPMPQFSSVVHEQVSTPIPTLSSVPSSGGLPPPPPPPPTASLKAPKPQVSSIRPTPPTNVKKTPVSPTNGSDLMQQIQLGMNLKKIDRDEIQRQKAASPPAPKGSHDILLDSIRKGVTLKKSTDRVLADKPKPASSEDVPMDVASILQAGLEKKFASVGDDSDDSFDSDSEDDEDWM